MKTSPRRRKHRRRAFRRLFWLLVLATLLLLLWPRRVTLDGLNSPHAILLRADSGEVLAEKDADSTIYPASMTKMMTVLLAIEANPDLDTPVTLPEEIFPALQAQNASLAGFQPGETVTVRDLLYGAMLPSGAECCEALAREVSGSVTSYSLPDEASAGRAQAEILAILRGKPDTESRVFYGFPVLHELYAADVVPMVDETIARHGPSEWRAGVLTNELHGHLGIYATIGVKMGIRAREYFNIGVDDIEVTTYAGHNPPISCMNDGLQVGTGASVGHGLITVAETDAPRPEARFSFKGKTLRLALKPEYARRIRDDVRRGIELYGDLTEPYWLYVRELALRYWRDFDRHEIFDMYVEE